MTRFLRSIRTILAALLVAVGVTALPNVPAQATTADHFEVTTSLSGGPATAGTAFNITVIARDSNDSNAIDTSYAGTVHFSLSSSDTGANLPAESTLSVGQRTFPVTLTKAGSQTINVEEAGNPGISGSVGPFTVGPGSPHHLAWGTQPTNTYAGQVIDSVVLDGADGMPLTVAVQDPFNNIETGDNASMINVTGPFIDATKSTRTVNGVASFPNLYATAAPSTGATIAATSSSFPTPVSSSQFDIVASADLSVSKTASASKADAGTDITYTLTAHNGGPSDVNDAVVTDSVPSDLTPVKYCQYAATTSSCTPNQSYSGSVSGIALTWEGPDDIIVITGHIPSGEPVPATFHNQASISSTTIHDPAPGNNSSLTVDTAIEAHANLAVAVGTEVDPIITSTPDGTATHVIAGTSMTFDVPVQNTGPSDNAGFDLVSDAPPGTYFLPSSGCTLTPSNSDQPAHAVCPQSSLTAGLTHHFALNLMVPSNYAIGNGGVSRGLSFSASVANFTTPQPPNSMGDDTATSGSITVYAFADLGLTMTSSPTGTVGNSDPLYAGNTGVFTVHVTNNNLYTPSDAAGYSFTLTLPGHTTFISHSPDSSPSSDSRCSLSPSGSTIICTSSSGLAHGVSDSFAIALNTLPDFVDLSSTNQATLTFRVYSLTTTTPQSGQSGNTSNDTPSSSPTVTGEADLGVTEEVTQPPVSSGLFSSTPGNLNKVHIVLTVKNNGGPSNARNVTVTDSLPSTLFSSATATPSTLCTITPSSGALAVSCSLGTMAPTGPTSTATVTIDATVDPTKRSGPISFVNHASVSSSPAVVDPDSSNNDSNPSNPPTAVSVPTVPDAPNLLQAQPGDQKIGLVWVDPATGGSAITGYDVIANGIAYYVSINPADTTCIPTIAVCPSDAHVVPGNQRSATIPVSPATLTNGITYSVKIEARNGAGDSNPSPNPSPSGPFQATPCSSCVITQLTGSRTFLLSSNGTDTVITDPSDPRINPGCFPANQNSTVVIGGHVVNAPGATTSDPKVSCLEIPAGLPASKVGDLVALRDEGASTPQNGDTMGGDCPLAGHPCMNGQSVVAVPPPPVTGTSPTQLKTTIIFDRTISTQIYGEPCTKVGCGKFTYVVYMRASTGVRATPIGTTVSTPTTVNGTSFPGWCPTNNGVPYIPTIGLNPPPGCVVSYVTVNTSSGGNTSNGKEGNGDLRLTVLFYGDPRVSP